MNDELLSELRSGRERFLELVAALRPDLHRYCARMTGSVADGEDIVQDTLARAYYALSELEELPPLRPWLFRIAHNRALDHVRSYEQRMTRPFEPVLDETPDQAPDAESALAKGEAVNAAITRFLSLPPVQRSTVILKDVLGDSMDEIGALLDLSLPAVKAALHRGRTRLESTREDAVEEAPPPSPALVRYAALFNARDWDGVRALLAEDVKLDLVSRVRRSGRRAVSNYFENYDKKQDWHFVPGWLEGREVMLVFRNPADECPGYFVELVFRDAKLASIRDFRYVPYILAD